MSAFGCVYFIDQLFLTNYLLKPLFRAGTVISVLLFFKIWVFLFSPKSCCGWLILFPMSTIILSLYIYVSMPSFQKELANKEGKEWMNGVNEKAVKSIQYLYECCGWSNITDHGLNPCPIYFRSSCSNIFENYTKSRFKEIKYSACTTIFLFLMSIFCLTYYAYHTNSDSLIGYIYFVETRNESDSNTN